nr:hypothetical protein CFP56_20597 [Quercus suber]
MFARIHGASMFPSCARWIALQRSPGKSTTTMIISQTVRLIGHLPYNKVEDEQILKLRTQGYSFAEISQRIQRPNNEVGVRERYQRLRALVSPAKKGPIARFTAEEDATLTMLRQQGKTFDEIAASVSRSYTGVRMRWIKLLRAKQSKPSTIRTERPPLTPQDAERLQELRAHKVPWDEIVGTHFPAWGIPTLANHLSLYRRRLHDKFHWTPEEDRTLRKLRAQGLTIRQIAEGNHIEGRTEVRTVTNRWSYLNRYTKYTSPGYSKTDDF